MSYNVDRIRSEFPSLNSGAAHFDGPGGSQVPQSVGTAIGNTLIASIANRGSVTQAERNAEEVVLDFRQAVADLIDVDPKGVVYGRSWTQLTYDFSRTLAKSWKPGDEIVVTRLDHDSNIRPWVQAAESVGAKVRWADFDIATGELPAAAIENVLSTKTRLVALTGASNVLGTRPDVTAIAKSVHAIGALLYVDGVHLTPHTPVSMKEMGADFYGFSAYKLLGPHCAALGATPALLETLSNDKLLPSTNAVPDRFEFGTLPYESMAAVTAAIDFIADLLPNQSGTRRERILSSMKALEVYENNLFEYMEKAITALPGVTTYGHAAHRTPTLFMTFAGIDAATVYRHLATKNINAPASNFYALEVSRALGLGDAGALRAGLAPYSTHAEVDRLVAGIAELL
ncbi:MAG TPA: cysteine desulfurase-like protein [Candidatus Nanopelagicaceae bacterium]